MRCMMSGRNSQAEDYTSICQARRNRNRRVQQRPGPANGSSPAKPKRAEPLAGSETETLILQSLAAYFCIILLQGVALAGSVSAFIFRDKQSCTLRIVEQYQ